jgi:hypothetical protein
MKVAAIKKLVEEVKVDLLLQAEEALIHEKPMPVEVDGEDEGEQLTHILAAIWILERMQEESVDFKTALRDYSKMVRESIN